MELDVELANAVAVRHLNLVISHHTDASACIRVGEAGKDKKGTTWGQRMHSVEVVRGGRMHIQLHKICLSSLSGRRHDGSAAGGGEGGMFVGRGGRGEAAVRARYDRRSRAKRSSERRGRSAERARSRSSVRRRRVAVMQTPISFHHQTSSFAAYERQLLHVSPQRIASNASPPSATTALLLHHGAPPIVSNSAMHSSLLPPIPP